MTWQLKYGILAILIALSSWFGYSAYYYFITSAQPVCAITGLEAGKSYAGDVHCTIHASHDYCVSDISLWLDNKPLLERFKINKAHCDHMFTLSTTALNDGNHVLKVQLTDGSYRHNVTHQEIPFTVDNVILQAALVKPATECKVFQGRTVHLQIQVNKEIKEAKVSALSRTYACFPESPDSTIYECFIPVACEEVPNEYLYTVDIQDHVGNHFTLENKFQVLAFPFKKQSLTVHKKPSEHEKYVTDETREFEEQMIQLAKQSPRKKLWRGAFYIPVDMTSISTEFGTIRTTQEKGRYAHKAIDLIAPPRSVVWAPNDGIVVLKRDYQHSTGKTIVIDHGYGLLTLLCHLDSFDNVDEGTFVKRGQRVGTEGTSGYSTGYHLHWGMSINGIEVDPMQWTKMNF